jgi:hypothetical protein
MMLKVSRDDLGIFAASKGWDKSVMTVFVSRS